MDGWDGVDWREGAWGWERNGDCAGWMDEDEDEDEGSERGGFRGLGVGKMAIWLFW